MADAILGPEYTVDLHCADQVQADNIRLALIHTSHLKKIALNPTLAEEIWTFFVGMVNACVDQNDFDHDGYEFQWERSPELRTDMEKDNNDHGLTITFSINILVKAEDFDDFEALLHHEKFGSMYREMTKAAFVEFLTKAGLFVGEDHVTVTESGFGYG